MLYINDMLPSEYKGRSHFQGDQAEIIATHQNDKLYDEFLKSRLYSGLINNVNSADTLTDSNMLEISGGVPENELSKYWEWIPYLSAGHVEPEIEEIQDIRDGKAFLRVNNDKKVIYVVKRSRGWYIFKTYFVAGTPRDIRLRPISQYWIKRIPDMLFFKSLLPGSTTADVVLAHDVNAGVYVDEMDNGNLHSKHAFADRYGTIVDITYREGSDGKLYVSKVEWLANGLNPLPYLLPIDRQLIDPSYVPPETPGCTIM